MRFAVIATSCAALVAIPLVAGAAAPQMSSDDFVSAVRCTAYENLASSDDVGAAKFRLNGEASRQSPATVAQAHKAASDVARAAASVDNHAGLAQRACHGATQA